MKITRAPIIVIALAAFMAISCKARLEHEILGKWVDGSARIVFSENGTFIQVGSQPGKPGSGGSISGKYEFVDPGQIKFVLDGYHVSGGAYVSSAAVSRSGSDLTLTDERGQQRIYHRETYYPSGR